MSFRPVPEGPQRARVRIVSQLRLVTGHRRQFGIEGGGDVNPGVRNKGARVRPFRTARRIEGVDGFDRGYRRPGRDQDCLKQYLVIAVDIAAILAVHD